MTGGARRRTRRSLVVVGWVLTVLVVVLLWPARLGGASHLLIVSGDSMLPNLTGGDLLVVRRSDRYDVGDVVAFTVPAGAGAGMRIVHRIVGIDEQGAVTTRGDNRTTDDSFAVGLDDLDGRVALRVPRGGRLLALLSRWWVLALAAGALSMLHFWPRRPFAPDADLDEAT